MFTQLRVLYVSIPRARFSPLSTTPQFDAKPEDLMTNADATATAELQTTAAPLYTEQQFCNVPPDKKCDLVMKGGVASGVLYPPAILKLATQYHFDEIGGTSAGAIAAAAAAAAEHGRAAGAESSANGAPQGFMRLQELQNILARDKFMYHLFQPSNGTEPLFKTFFELKDQISTTAKARTEQQAQPRPAQTRLPTSLARIWSGIRTARAYLDTLVPILRRNTAAAYGSGRATGLRWGIIVALALTAPLIILAALYGTIAWLAGWPTNGAPMFIICVLFGLVWGAVLGLLARYVGGIAGSAATLWQQAYQLTDRDKTLIGICHGSKSKDTRGRLRVDTIETADKWALTDWLAVSLNELAGLPADWIMTGPNQAPAQFDHRQLLTFRSLKDRGVKLRLVTTNLSEKRPYILPSSADNQFELVFRADDMLKLFPANVVEYLKHYGGQQRRNVQLPSGYYFLPEGDDLPVVVATRMSLSFPILLSAVRLYTIKGALSDQANTGQDKRVVIAPGDLLEHWFSDGGITSNFPIHMFDAWRPSHPTFGLKLYGLLSPEPKDAADSKRQQDPAQNSDQVAAKIEVGGVYLPPPQESERSARPVWSCIASLPTFLSSILDTMQNYRDNTQSMLPGYRERIVQVYLGDNEGGMNLDMQPDVIERVMEKGRNAGTLLTNKPDPGNPETQYFDFEQHQWVRFRVLMDQLEKQVAKLKRSLGSTNGSSYERLVAAYCTLINQQLAAQKRGQPWYKPMSLEDSREAQKRIQTLWLFIKAWERADQERKQQFQREHPQAPPDAAPPNDSFFGYDAPAPSSVLRVTPEL